METPTIRMGRPKGKPYPHVRSLRFSPQDISRLQRLAVVLDLMESQVIRLAIRELAKKERVE